MRSRPAYEGRTLSLRHSSAPILTTSEFPSLCLKEASNVEVAATMLLVKAICVGSALAEAARKTSNEKIVVFMSGPLKVLVNAYSPHL